jgi:hypothetical protein
MVGIRFELLEADATAGQRVRATLPLLQSCAGTSLKELTALGVDPGAYIVEAEFGD